MPQYSGNCGCGNIEVQFCSEVSPTDWPIRLCGCSQCQKRGGRYTSDVNGTLKFSVRDFEKFIRYSFGLRTLDMLICGVCGIHVGAYAEEAGKAYGVLNVSILKMAPTLTQTAETVSFEGEDEAQRRERHVQKWTPASIDGL